MKDTTKTKLIKLLKQELGREPSDQEIANAQTDHNLMARLAVQLAEEASDSVVVLDASIDQKIEEKVNIKVEEAVDVAVEAATKGEVIVKK